MRVPLFNDYNPLPAQQAAAAAQHPMLAPRPVDAAAMGYNSFQPAETAPPERLQTANPPQFYYPAPPVQVPHPWPSQPAAQDGQRQLSLNAVDYQRSQSQAVSPEQNKFQHKLEAAAEAPWPVIDRPNFQGEDYTSTSVAPAASETPEDKSDENNAHPQVSTAILT